MADQYGINVGNVLSKASAIKSAKVNMLAKNQALENDKTDRASRLEQATRQKGNVQKMASADPRMEGYEVETQSELQQVQSFLNNADAKTKAEALQKVDTIGKYSMAILNSKDPKQKEAMWKDLKANMPASEKASMPDEYSEKWLVAKATEAKTIKDMIAQDVAKTKVQASQKAIESKYKNDVKLESQKQRNKIKFEAAKSKKEKKETKTKLEKLFDLRENIKATNPNDPRIAEVNAAIKLTTEGRPSEIEKLLAMQVVDPTIETPKETKKAEVKTEKDFTNKWGF